jgi:hypothetical protein
MVSQQNISSLQVEVLFAPHGHVRGNQSFSPKLSFSIFTRKKKKQNKKKQKTKEEKISTIQ